MIGKDDDGSTIRDSGGKFVKDETEHVNIQLEFST
jgi:hypothetical protein